MTLNGIDVSKYQATTPNLNGLSFLFARATYGAVHDPMYATHIANARKAGLLVGAYHFGVGDVPVADQVSAFLAAAGSVDFYVLDLESNGNHPSMSAIQAKAFIAAVKAKGHKCGLYHSESGYPSLGQTYNWVANWSQVPSIHWTFHQYRGSPLDLDHFIGDMAALRALAGQGPTPKVVESASSSPSERSNVMILGAAGVTSTRVMALAKGQPLFEKPGGARVTRMSRAAPLDYVGHCGPNWGAVVVGTGIPYHDGQTRPTVLYVPRAAGPISAR